MPFDAPAHHDELIAHLGRSTGLPASVLRRIVADVLDYFGEPAPEFVRRRHAELRARGLSNADVWPHLAADVARARFPVALSERQLRRAVYG